MLNLGHQLKHWKLGRILITRVRIPNPVLSKTRFPEKSHSC